MRTVWNISTSLDAFPEQLRQKPGAMPTKRELVRAVQRMLDELVREPRAGVVDVGRLIASFNALLQQVKEQFLGADTLRLIEPRGLDASVALLAVRLALVTRMLQADLAHSTPEAS